MPQTAQPLSGAERNTVRSAVCALDASTRANASTMGDGFSIIYRAIGSTKAHEETWRVFVCHRESKPLSAPMLSKDLFLLDADVVFLNHGSFGATPRPVFE